MMNEQMEKTSAMTRLEALVGLEDVKKQVLRLVTWLDIQARRQQDKFNLIVSFEGDDVESKRKVALILADILVEKGHLTTHQLCPTPYLELNGELFRGSDQLKEKLDAFDDYLVFATGRVGFLFTPDISAIVKQLSIFPANRLFIFDQFRSRGQQADFTIKFDGYDVNELASIVEKKLINKGLRLTATSRQYLLQKMQVVSDKGNLANAEGVATDILIAQAERVAKQPNANVHQLLKADFSLAKGENAQKQASSQDRLSKMIGLTGAKTAIATMLATVEVNQARRKAGIECLEVVQHMAFLGNPGTGKTEVAKLIGKILFEQHLLPKEKFHQVTAKNLIAEYVGQTAPLVASVFNRAKGGVLFIDEAYGLLRGEQGSRASSFSEEALAEMMVQLDERKYDTVVILAGYDKEMQELFDGNPGFRSRVPNIIHFEDYAKDELLDILELMTEKQGLKLASGVRQGVRTAMVQMLVSDKFGNARGVRNLLDFAVRQQALRLHQGKNYTKSAMKTLLVSDFDGFFESSEVVSGESVSRQIGFRIV